MMSTLAKFLLVFLFVSDVICRRVPEHNTTSDGDTIEEIGEIFLI